MQTAEHDITKLNEMYHLSEWRLIASGCVKLFIRAEEVFALQTLNLSCLNLVKLHNEMLNEIYLLEPQSGLPQVLEQSMPHVIYQRCLAVVDGYQDYSEESLLEQLLLTHEDALFQYRSLVKKLNNAAVIGSFSSKIASLQLLHDELDKQYQRLSRRD